MVVTPFIKSDFSGHNITNRLGMVDLSLSRCIYESQVALRNNVFFYIGKTKNGAVRVANSMVSIDNETYHNQDVIQAAKDAGGVSNCMTVRFVITPYL